MARRKRKEKQNAKQRQSVREKADQMVQLARQLETVVVQEQVQNRQQRPGNSTAARCRAEAAAAAAAVTCGDVGSKRGAMLRAKGVAHDARILARVEQPKEDEELRRSSSSFSSGGWNCATSVT